MSFGYRFSPRVRIPVGTISRPPLFSLRNIAWCSRPWFVDGRISTKNSPRGRPHWSGSFKFKGPQGGLFPEAPPRESQPAKEFAGLSVWQPRVLSLGGLYVVPLAPPSLGYFLWGFPFSALDVPRGNHTLKDSQQSVVHHERAPSQELERDRYPTARCTKPAAHSALLSVHTLLRVSSSRTRSSSRSSFLCWSVFCSLLWWRQSATLPQTVAPVIVLGLFDHCAGGSGALEAYSKKHDRMRARHFGFEES